MPLPIFRGRWLKYRQSLINKGVTSGANERFFQHSGPQLVDLLPYGTRITWENVANASKPIWSMEREQADGPRPLGL